MASTAVEQALEVAILSRCSDKTLESALFLDESAPIQSFHAKTVVSRALGLIGRAANEDLVMIRNIRNLFAHSRIEVDFDAPEVVAACELITLPERLELETEGGPAPPIERYVRSCVEYVACLMSYETDPLGKKLGRFGSIVLDLKGSSPGQGG
ncbi:MAG: hypothetical protein ACK41C_14965 [Phenylobacterium sp.]|uniref:hypothetical protein n=1 Tax=Phenylobacterium sp. TaxID=1871053 RepID=UPI00391DE6CB